MKEFKKLSSLIEDIMKKFPSWLTKNKTNKKESDKSSDEAE
jgi:hypothetical protein